MDVNLVLFKKDGTQKVFQLPTGVTVIGRRPDCHLRVPVQLVSRRHCQLSCKESKLTIRDLDSLNGTFLNGKRVDEAVIQAGDRIKVGPITLTLQIDGSSEKADGLDALISEMPEQDLVSDSLTAIDSGEAPDQSGSG